jgi:hypothetical protein
LITLLLLVVVAAAVMLEEILQLEAVVQVAM